MEEKNFSFNIDDLSVNDLYKIAVAIEEQGYTFYNDIIEAADEVRVKNEVKYLRDEEVKHKNFFMKQIKNGGSGLDAEEVNKLIQTEIIEPSEEYYMGGKIKQANDALRFGAVLEQRSIDFYEKLKAKEQDENILVTIDSIIEEEKKHMKKIYLILSY